jgi:hypothetical protein|tara:strand:+ start:220 stop:408 length:189 start_codon:yes stop_codon:yes gene_type:complete
MHLRFGGGLMPLAPPRLGNPLIIDLFYEGDLAKREEMAKSLHHSLQFGQICRALDEGLVWVV